MTELMKTRASLVADVVSELAAEAQARICPSPELWSKLHGVLVRDHDANYWTVGVRSRRWYRYAAGQWQASPAPEGSLEGPLWIRDRVPVGDADMPGAGEPDDAVGLPGESRPDDLTPFQVNARDTYSDYDRGLYSSRDAEELLQNNYVVETSGVLWAVGCRSGTWYSWRDGQWRGETDAPAPESLNRRQDRAALTHKILYTLGDLLATGTPLPERVVDPWQPPDHLPETLVVCASCGATNPQEGGFCVRCGGPAEGFVNSPEQTSFYPPQNAGATDGSSSCPTCGKAMEGADKFCSSCGAAAGTPSPPQCTQCGVVLRGGAAFCSRCGAPVAGGAGGGRP